MSAMVVWVNEMNDFLAYTAGRLTYRALIA